MKKNQIISFSRLIGKKRTSIDQFLNSGSRRPFFPLFTHQRHGKKVIFRNDLSASHGYFFSHFHHCISFFNVDCVWAMVPHLFDWWAAPLSTMDSVCSLSPHAGMDTYHLTHTQTWKEDTYTWKFAESWKKLKWVHVRASCLDTNSFYWRFNDQETGIITIKLEWNNFIDNWKSCVHFFHKLL